MIARHLKKKSHKYLFHSNVPNDNFRYADLLKSQLSETRYMVVPQYKNVKLQGARFYLNY